jgi:hypothetical protein
MSAQHTVGPEADSAIARLLASQADDMVALNRRGLTTRMRELIGLLSKIERELGGSRDATERIEEICQIVIADATKPRSHRRGEAMGEARQCTGRSDSDALMSPDPHRALCDAAESLIAALNPNIPHSREVVGPLAGLMHRARISRAAIAETTEGST